MSLNCPLSLTLHTAHSTLHPKKTGRAALTDHPSTIRRPHLAPILTNYFLRQRKAGPVAMTGPACICKPKKKKPWRRRDAPWRVRNRSAVAPAGTQCPPQFSYCRGRRVGTAPQLPRGVPLCHEQRSRWAGRLSWGVLVPRTRVRGGPAAISPPCSVVSRIAAARRCLAAGGPWPLPACTALW